MQTTKRTEQENVRHLCQKFCHLSTPTLLHLSSSHISPSSFLPLFIKTKIQKKENCVYLSERSNNNKLLPLLHVLLCYIQYIILK